MSTATSQSQQRVATQPPAPGLPDGTRVQEQLAALTEGGEIRPLLEFLRTLLNARALAVFPTSDRPGAASVAVTTRGILATSLEPLAARLGNATAAVVENAESLGADGYTIAVPVLRDNHPLWVLIAQFVVSNQRDLQSYLVILQSVAGYLLYREQRLASEDIHWVLGRTSGLLDVFRRAGAEEDYEKACRIAVDALCDYLGCSRVVYANGARLAAMSGISKLDTKSPVHQPTETAMREAVLEGERVDFPATKSALAHEFLAKATGAASITTVPFGKRACLFEWDAEPDHQMPALPFVPPLFELLERARPHPAAFFFRRAWTKASANRRKAIAAALALCATILVWPVHYTIKCDCRLVPKTKRVIAAPFDGLLGRTKVQPGDRVQHGDALVALDSRELKLKEAELIASRDQALKKRDRAMSNPDGVDFSAAQVAAFEAAGVAEELSLVQQKLAVLDIRAPISGMVVAGDLRRAEGQPVKQGQVLFELAPLEEMLVEIDVPDREFSRVRTGMPVAFRMEAYSGWSGDSQVARLYPQSEQRDGKNIFVAEAPVSGAAPDLRPGMRGRAAIEGDRKPIAWIIGHRFVDWVKTAIWW
jgi:biotin carboxyl carrier protein